MATQCDSGARSGPVFPADVWGGSDGCREMGGATFVTYRKEAKLILAHLSEHPLSRHLSATQGEILSH